MRNGYNPSIVQADIEHCFLCGNSSGKLDRHEVWGGSNRQKSKALGLWVVLCHEPCHLSLAHGDRKTMDYLHQTGQRAAMEKLGLSTEEFIKLIGRNYL